MNAEHGTILTCEEVRDALGAYALGALDPDEIEGIEAHLVTCAACRAELARDMEAVDALAVAIAPSVAPSPDVRARLLATARATPAYVDPAPVSLAQRAAKSRVPSWVLPIMAAAATLLLVGVGVLGVLLTRAIDERNDAVDAAQLLSTYVSAGGQVVTLSSQPAPAYEGYDWQGSLVTAPGKNPVVVVAGCPKSGEYMTYWVWFARDGKRTPAGKLTVGANGSGYLALNGNEPLSDFDSIGITVVLDNQQRQDVLVAPLDDTVQG
jgi:hypothetical protein